MADRLALIARNADLARARAWFMAKHDAPIYQTGEGWTEFNARFQEWREAAGFDRFMARAYKVTYRAHGFREVKAGGWRYVGPHLASYARPRRARIAKQVSVARFRGMRRLVERILGPGVTLDYGKGQFMQVHVERTGPAQWTCGGQVASGYWVGGSPRLRQAVETFYA